MITRTFDCSESHTFTVLLTPPRQALSPYLARVSADQGPAFHTRTVELTPTLLFSCDRGRLEIPARGATPRGRHLGAQQAELPIPGVAHGLAVRCDLNIPQERASHFHVCRLASDANLVLSSSVY